MIVRTKYRDIPFEQVLKCVIRCNTTGNRTAWEKKMRGAPIVIQTPQVSDEVAAAQREMFVCGGPFFMDVTNNARNAAVCVHIAEIGD